MFDGLKVAKNNKMLCEKWMNQCPVIFLSFKDVDGRTFENAFELLKFTITQFCDAHAWLENSEKVTDAQKLKMINEVKSRNELADLLGISHKRFGEYVYIV